MEVVWRFIMEHWMFCSSIALEVVFGVLLLLKKGKCNEPLLSVVSSLPRFIVFAENKFGSGHGEEKKKYVMELAIDYFKDLTGVDIKDKSSLVTYLSSKIEDILKTPLKKEDK